MTDSNAFGGYGGTTFSDVAPEGSKIIGFYLAKNQNYLEYIRPLYSDGTEGSSHGTLTGNQDLFKLKKDEVWVKISVKCATYVDAIQFTTNQRTSKWFGGFGGSLYDVAVNGDIIGVKGRSGSWIDQLQFTITEEKVPDKDKEVSTEERLARDMSAWVEKNTYGDVSVEFSNKKFMANMFVLNQAPKIAKLVNKGVLYVKDSEAEGLMEIIKYLYCGLLEITDSNYMSVLTVADAYGVDDVRKACFEYIIKCKCTVNSVCELLAHTKTGKFATFGTEDLKKRCIDFISTHTAGVCKSHDFINLDHEFVLSLLKQDELDVDESKLFQAIYRWGLNQKNLTPNKSLEEILKDLLPLIRFSSMDGKDLVKTVKPTGLIDSKLYLKILEMQTAPEGYEIRDPLPEAMPRGSSRWILDWKTGGFPNLWQMSDGNRTIKKIGGGSTWNNAMIYGKKLTSGIHYWEFKINSVNNDRSGSAVGICKDPKNKNQYAADMVIGLSGYQYNMSGNTSTSMNNGDRVGVLLHFPKKKVYFYHNGTQMGVTGDLQPKQAYYPCIHIYYQNDSFTLQFPNKKPTPK